MIMVRWPIWFGFVTVSLVGQTSYISAQVPPASMAGPAHSSAAPPRGVIFPPMPLAGFDPVTASDQDLKFYGFPPRPDVTTNPSAYAHWHRMLSASKTRITPVVRETNVYHGPPRSLSPATHKPLFTQGSLTNPSVTNSTLLGSQNWSGYADVYSSSAPFLGTNSWVSAEWVIPLAQQAPGTCSGGWEYSAQWLGFDGINSNDVLQAGSTASAYCNGSTTASDYNLWFEWYPNPESTINLTVNPGDLIGVEVWYAGNQTGGTYWINYNTGVSTLMGFSAPTGTTFVGNSIEWIVEAPTVSGSQSILANYTAVPWDFAWGNSTTTGAIYEPSYAPGADGTAYDIEMINTSDTVISACLSFEYIYMMWCYPPGPALQ
jgi:hypothetical protein